MSKEIIESITEGVTFEVDVNYTEYDGYLVKTNKQVIKIGISNNQQCCEDWGYISSEEEGDLDTFVGAEILGITSVDTALKVNDIYLKGIYIGIDACMFVNIETSKGTLQFVAYNEHSGYYGHDAIVVSEQLKEEVGL